MTPIPAAKTLPELACLLALLLAPAVVAAQTAVHSVPPPVRSMTDAIARSGNDYFYNMEFDQAIRDFESLVKAHPDDPFPNNYLLAAVIFKELYRIGALESELYARESFLDEGPRHPLDPAVTQRVEQLEARSESLANAQLARNPNNVDALYARGVVRSLRSTYMGLGQKSWWSAVRSSLAARRDHERVLQLDPSYVDAKMVVGMHNYIIGCMNWAQRLAASMFGITGNKQKGLDYLREVAHSETDATWDARVALALFLRREERYPEALDLLRTMEQAYPRSFLLSVEYGNLLNAAGHGKEAIAQFRLTLANQRAGKYQLSQPELAWWGLGVSLRGQRMFAEAAEAFDSAASTHDADPSLVSRATLTAGEMYDTLGNRTLALARYQAVIAAGGPRADTARRHVRQPYHYDRQH